MNRLLNTDTVELLAAAVSSSAHSRHIRTVELDRCSSDTREAAVAAVAHR